ncbi:MAG: UDP-N-acetylglucosamine 2-epimerase (non-hydrolyzing) [Acidobacteriota bacterium]
MTRTVVSVVGARPNFLKIAPLHRELCRSAHEVRNLIVHTGQHYDFSMSEAFFRDLELPTPDHYLEVGSGSHSVQTARVMTRFEEVVKPLGPDLVVVFGDVNSTLGCALVCAKEQIPLAHVEAGLRSFDRSMPEEINRLLTDQVSDFCFVSERAGVENLMREGVSGDKIFLVGNIMIDTLVLFEEKIIRSDVLERLGLDPSGYALVTLHRPGNVDDPSRLQDLVALLSMVEHRLPVVFPVHPRTLQNLRQGGLIDRLRNIPRLVLTEPLGYLDFMCLVRHARVVLTDSGGLQAETTYLNVTCLTLRDTTEQPVTLELGTNTLAGFSPSAVLEYLDGRLQQGIGVRAHVPLWDGKTAERIVQTLQRAWESPNQKVV